MKTERPHKKLHVWIESIELTKMIYTITSDLPKEEIYGLSSQLRRAAVSVSANIAEGSARHTNKEFIYFLYISSGSLSELDTLIEICFQLMYVNEKMYFQIKEKIDLVSAMLSGLIRNKKSIESNKN